MTNEAKTYKFSRDCAECGEKFLTNRREAEFCPGNKDKCRKTYNNRRYLRGAELYDILMTCRFDRDFAAKEGLQLSSIMSNLAQHYRNADKAYRNGRKSWDKYAHTRLPLAYSDAGDNR